MANDVKITFLNGELEEEVYIIQSEGFTSMDESKVCKLQRSIMDWSRHVKIGTCILVKWSERMASLGMKKNIVFISEQMVL